MKIEIKRIETPGDAVIRALSDLLIDAVEDGAEVSFLAPLSPEDAAAYWRDISRSDSATGTQLFGAWANGKLGGCVQLTPESSGNALHRASVDKLIVATDLRGRGVASRLLDMVERTALELDRKLLVLDTEAGSVAHGLYRRRGWTEIGIAKNFTRRADGSFCDTAFMTLRLDPPE